MIIRRTDKKDIAEILEIYNYEVRNGVATLDIAERTLTQWEEWFFEHDENTHPIYVAEEDGVVMGYASLSEYRKKEAYKSTVELSVYVGAEYRKKGVASELMTYILNEARENREIHNVVSVITSGNDVSKHLHEKFGFEFCGTIKEVGTKFGKLLDIDNYSLLV